MFGVHGGAWEGVLPPIVTAAATSPSWRSPPGPAPDGQESAGAARAIVMSGVTIYERLERPGHPSGCPALLGFWDPSIYPYHQKSGGRMK
jgi:hypothetical protein